MDLRNTIEGYKSDIKAIESKYTQEISNLKDDHKKLLEKEVNGIREQLESKHAVELDKKDLELQRLKNELEQLNPKVRK